MSAGLKLGAASLGLLAIGSFASGSVPSVRSLSGLFSSVSSKSEVAEAGSKKEEKRVEKEVSQEKIVEQETTSNLVKENIEPVIQKQVSEPTVETIPVASTVQEKETNTYQAPVTLVETRKEVVTPKTATKPLREEAVLEVEGKKDSKKPSSKGNGDGGFCSNLLGIWRVKDHTQCSTKTSQHYWEY